MSSIKVYIKKESLQYLWMLTKMDINIEAIKIDNIIIIDIIDYRY